MGRRGFHEADVLIDDTQKVQRSTGFEPQRRLFVLRRHVEVELVSLLCSRMPDGKRYGTAGLQRRAVEHTELRRHWTQLLQTSHRADHGLWNQVRSCSTVEEKADRSAIDLETTVPAVLAGVVERQQVFVGVEFVDIVPCWRRPFGCFRQADRVEVVPATTSSTGFTVRRTGFFPSLVFPVAVLARTCCILIVSLFLIVSWLTAA